MPDQFKLATEALDVAFTVVDQGRSIATAVAGVGHAVLALTAQVHLGNLIGQYQALCTLAGAGQTNEAAEEAMRMLEARITEGLGLKR